MRLSTLLLLNVGSVALNLSGLILGAIFGKWGVVCIHSLVLFYSFQWIIKYVCCILDAAQVDAEEGQ